MCALPTLVASRIRRPAGRGQGATVSSPRPALRAWGAQHRGFHRDVHQCDCAFRPAAPVRTPPPPIQFFRCPTSFMGGDTNCSLSMPCFPGCPALLKQLGSRRSAGTPRRYRAARCRACTCSQCRHALGRRRGSPRLAGPGRAQLFSHSRSHDAVATHTRGRVSHRCPRLHAAPSVRSPTKERMFGAVRPGVFWLTH